jgi:hypothetical protein
MRAMVAALVVGLVLVPEAAWAARNTGECRRITRQIAHFEDVGRLAEERGDQLWEDATRGHIGRLELRRAGMCPEYAEQLRSRSRAARVARQTKELFKMAAKVAVRFFTFGAF